MHHEGPIFGVGHSCGGATLLVAEAMSPGTFRALLVFEPPIFDPALHPGTAIIEMPLAKSALRRKFRFPSIRELRSYLLSKPLYASWDSAALEGYMAGGFQTDAADDSLVLSCRPQTEAALFASVFPLRRWEWIHGGRLNCPLHLCVGADSRFGQPILGTILPLF